MIEHQTRMANKVKDAILASYDLYKESVEEPVSKQTYVTLNRLFMKYMSAVLLETGEVALPERLGKITVQGTKAKFRIENEQIKGLPPDWQATKELWERNPEAKAQKRILFHFNEDTGGVRFKFLWNKTKVVTPNKRLYQIRLARPNKRLLAANIKAGKEYKIV